MQFSRTLIVSAIFILIIVGVAVWLYPHLPAQVPTHWDMQGHVNGYSSRLWTVAPPVLTIIGLALLTVILPLISPRKFEIKPFAAVWDLIMLAIQGVVLVIFMAVLLDGAGYRIPISTISVLALGVLLMVIGNYMGKLRKNFFIGIRTPWTLASSAVWERTHRLAGWLFMLAGLIITVGALRGESTVFLLMIVLLPAALIPSAYSLLIYPRYKDRD